MFNDFENQDQALEKVFDLYLMYKEFFLAPIQDKQRFTEWVKKTPGFKNLLGGISYILGLSSYSKDRYLKNIKKYEDIIIDLYSSIEELEEMEDDGDYDYDEYETCREEVEDNKSEMKLMLAKKKDLSGVDMITLQRMAGATVIMSNSGRISVSQYIYENKAVILCAIKSWYQYLGVEYANCFANRTYVSRLAEEFEKGTIHVDTKTLLKIAHLNEKTLSPNNYKEAVQLILKIENIQFIMSQDQDLDQEETQLSLKKEAMELILLQVKSLEDKNLSPFDYIKAVRHILEIENLQGILNVENMQAIVGQIVELDDEILSPNEYMQSLEAILKTKDTQYISHQIKKLNKDKKFSQHNDESLLHVIKIVVNHLFDQVKRNNFPDPTQQELLISESDETSDSDLSSGSDSSDSETGSVVEYEFGRRSNTSSDSDTDTDSDDEEITIATLPEVLYLPVTEVEEEDNFGIAEKHFNRIPLLDLEPEISHYGVKEKFVSRIHPLAELVYSSILCNIKDTSEKMPGDRGREKAILKLEDLHNKLIELNSYLPTYQSNIYFLYENTINDFIDDRMIFAQSILRTVANILISNISQMFEQFPGGNRLKPDSVNELMSGFARLFEKHIVEAIPPVYTLSLLKMMLILETLDPNNHDSFRHLKEELESLAKKVAAGRSLFSEGKVVEKAINNSLLILEQLELQEGHQQSCRK